MTYIVQPGDTLFSIAQQFGVSVQALMQANGLTVPGYVYVGQRLIIPRPQPQPPFPFPFPPGPDRNLEQRVTRLEAENDRQTQRIQRLDNEIDRLRQRVNRLEDRVNRLDNNREE